MFKATSIVTALGVTLSSFSLASVPAKAGNAGGVVAGGIIGFAAGAIVGSQLGKNKTKTYRRGSGRSQEEREYWMYIQDALNRLGYDAGPVDGAPGRRTRQAIREFQMSIPDVPDGKLTPDQTQLLFARAYPEAAPSGEPDSGAPTANSPQQQGQTYPNAAMSGSGSSAAPVQPSTSQGAQQPVIAISNPVADAAADATPTACVQPQIQVDDNGRQFIELNGQKFVLQPQ